MGKRKTKTTAITEEDRFDINGKQIKQYDICWFYNKPDKSDMRELRFSHWYEMRKGSLSEPKNYVAFVKEQHSDEMTDWAWFKYCELKEISGKVTV